MKIVKKHTSPSRRQRNICAYLRPQCTAGQEESTQDWSDERIDQLANASMDWLQSRHAMNIEVMRIRSPREFERQLNLYHGAIYGVSAAKGLTGLFPHKSPIDGLYLAGQTTFPGLGIPTAASSGIHASKKLLQDFE